MRKSLLTILALSVAMSLGAAPIKIKGVLNNNRYDDGDQLKSEYLGYVNGKAIFLVDLGIYALEWDGKTLSTPIKEPAVVKSEVLADPEKQVWAANFNLMYGNSGAVHAGSKLVTVMSRDYQSTEDYELFAVRKWDANTGDLLNNSDEYMDVSKNIESAGMSYNPKDGKVYGFFHITDAKLMDEVLNDPNYSPDEDDVDSGREGLDDGYCLGTIDLATMKITPITPGLYYGNFVTFAINSEGRGFVMTSGGANGYLDEDGKMRNIDHELTGAQLIEIDLKTGLMKRDQVTKRDPATGESYIGYKYPLPATGYCSQVRRQAACFAKSDPSKMYWIGFYNSGKGVNSTGSWTTLDQREWRTNGLFDTALYVVDVNTGECQRLAKVPTRASYSCIWIEGDDPSEDADENMGNIVPEEPNVDDPKEDPKDDPKEDPKDDPKEDDPKVDEPQDPNVGVS
ncbi:MAG: hypothetical protein J1F43_07395, partial [Muribaculaceae bacterium]|nr:hypothetical protein [Muribaculaceae bacterium]